MDNTSEDTKDDSVQRGRGGIASAFFESAGIFGVGKIAKENLKLLGDIESTSRLTSINARKVQFLLGVALDQQVPTTKLTSEAAAGIVPASKPTVGGGNLFRSILAGLLGALPLLLNDKVRENLGSYFKELLEGMGVTNEVLQKAISIVKVVGGFFVAYGILKIVSFFRKVIKLFGVTVAILKYIVKLLGVTSIPGVDVPDGSRNTRPGTGPTPAPGGRPPVSAPPVKVPPLVLLPGNTTPRLPGPSGPAISTIPGATPPMLPAPVAKPPPRLAELRSRAADAVEANIIRETLTPKPNAPTQPPGTSSISGLGSIISKIGRILPIINLLLGAHDLYRAYELFKAGETANAAIAAIGGLGTIMLGVGMLISAPVLAPILTGVGIVASLGSLAVWAAKELYESIGRNDPNNVTDPSDIPNPEPVYKDERPMKFSELSKDITMSKYTRARNTDVVILTKPVIIYNRAFA